ncbi:hypothetical protein [[Clostridium] colinum]|uniref:hypothetical protein n=1 Tax=[Clostridium] colinum TaxID=36835 RepID=UPI002024035C|nr:hypothetical protein [[Clostridium] colinum]
MSNKSNMTNCKNCNCEIAKVAKICPKCGAKNKQPFYKRPFIIILIILVFITFIGIIIIEDSSSYFKVTTETKTKATETTSEENIPN